MCHHKESEANSVLGCNVPRTSRRFYFVFLLVHLLAIVAPVHVPGAVNPQFSTLDSTVNADLQTSPRAQLEKLIAEMQAIANSPYEQGRCDYSMGMIHLLNSEFGLCLLKMESAQVQFDSAEDHKSSMEAQVYQANCHFLMGRSEEAVSISRRLIRECSLLPEESVSFKVFRLSANLYGEQGNLDSAMYFQKKVADLTLKEGNIEANASAQLQIAYYWQVKGKRRQALEAALEIGDRINSLTDYRLQIRYYNFLGMVYLGLEQGYQSIKSHRKALEISKKYGFLRLQANTLSSLAISQKVNGDTTAAIRNLQESLEICMEVNDLIMLNSIYSGLAGIYMGKKNWKLAQKNAESALFYSQQINQTRGISFASLLLGEIRIAKEEYAEALVNLQVADSITRTLGNWQRVQTINQLMSQACEELGDMEKALEYQRLASAMQDSVDFMDAKKYADSLMLAQGPALEETEDPSTNVDPDSESNGNQGYLLAGLSLIVVLLLVFWGIKRKASRNTESDTKTDNDEREVPAPKGQVVTAPLPASDAEPQIPPKDVAEIIETLRKNKDWTAFMLQFEAIYPGLIGNISNRHPDLTPTDIRVLVLARLSLSTAEHAEIMGVSAESAKKARYRTRKRLSLETGQSLMQYMLKG